MRPLKILLLLAAPLLMAAGIAGPPSAQVIVAMTPSVVRIVAAGCQPGQVENVGTGFVWPEPGDVVTDLHVLIGCSGPITVTYWIGGEKSRPYQAGIRHVLISRDLVSLHVADAPPQAVPLPIDPKPPNPDDLVKVYGYPRAIAAPEDKRLAVSIQTETFPQLKWSLDQQARAELEQLKFPGLDTEVVHLDGSLSPGHSGAPVIDAAGHVVGIGSGGLQEGAAGISWAVRAEYLDELLKQGTDMPRAAGSGGALYAMLQTPPTQSASVEPDIPSLACGALTLTRQTTLPLARLIQTSPNQAAIRRLAETQLNLRLEQMADDAYEIWSEPGSGAAVVVPPGARLIDRGNFCVTEHHDHPQIYNLIRLFALPGTTTAPEWQFDLEQDRWSALATLSSHAGAGLLRGAPEARPWRLNAVVNGAWVTRELWQNPHTQDGRYVRVLRADLAGRGAYVMTAALARTQTDQLDDASHLAWAQGVLAVYLSSFPPRGEASATTGEAANTEGTEVPAHLAALRLYPVLHCGGIELLRLSATPGIEATLQGAGDADRISELVAQASGIRPAGLAAGMFDLWGQPQSGLGALLPRGMTPAADKAFCLAQDNAQPDLRFAVFGLKNADAADTIVQRRLENLAEGPLAEAPAIGKLRRFEGNSKDGHTLRIWLGAQLRRGQTLFMVLSERDPQPPGTISPRAVALAADLTALCLSLQPVQTR